MIDSITIKGFLSIRSIRELPLRPLNVLIGANGAGKSCLIDAIRLFRLAATRPSRIPRYVEAQGGAHRVLHYGPKVTSDIRMAVNANGAAYGFRLGHSTSDSLQFVPVGGLRPVSELAETAARWRTYHFADAGHQSPLLRTARIEDNRCLEADGANLAAILYLIRQRHPASFSAILDTVRMVVPFLDDLILEPRALNEATVRLDWRHVGFDQRFDAASLSDGTLRLIALVTALLQPHASRPNLILIDEPELGLHPSAISLVAELIRSASAHGSQVVVATQSSHLVDHFEPHEVLVAERERGGTRVTRLDRERLEPWLDDYSLGQLWEKNELGASPRPETEAEAQYG